MARRLHPPPHRKLTLPAVHWMQLCCADTLPCVSAVPSLLGQLVTASSKSIQHFIVSSKRARPVSCRPRAFQHSRTGHTRPHTLAVYTPVPTRLSCGAPGFTGTFNDE